MANKKSRPLYTFELVEHFLLNALNFPLNRENYAIVSNIVSTELNLENFDEQNITKNSKAYRNLYYRSDVKRLELCKKIVEELLLQKRLENDNDICLGKGGAIPLTEFQQNSQAFILIGLPASGKSTIANEIADHYGAVILDSDYAKMKFPEYKALPFGATLVHEESRDIIFGNSDQTGFDSVFKNITKYRLNCVIPKIGANLKGISDLITALKLYDYEVHLTLVKLDRKKATRRALTRYLETGRYVPLGLIFDTYANNPTISYYQLKPDNRISSFGILSTDVKKGDKPLKIESSPKNPAGNY